MAVFQSPWVFEKRAWKPVAVFELPLVMESSAPSPVAVFEYPVVVKLPALGPTKMFLPQGITGGEQIVSGKDRTGVPPMLMTPILGPVVLGRKRLPFTLRLALIV
jgi:hypothetical protein